MCGIDLGLDDTDKSDFFWFRPVASRLLDDNDEPFQPPALRATPFRGRGLKAAKPPSLEGGGPKGRGLAFIIHKT